MKNVWLGLMTFLTAVLFVQVFLLLSILVRVEIFFTKMLLRVKALEMELDLYRETLEKGQ